MNIDYQKLGRYVLVVNLLLTGLVFYVGWDVMSTEAAPGDDRALFATVKPAKKAEPKLKSIFQDYSIITADRFLPRPGAQSGEPFQLLPVPGASSALDRLMKLRGTAVSSEKGQSFAIVELLQSREFRTVRAGEEVGGATVVDIGESSVLVSMENEEVTLFLNAAEEYGTGSKKKSANRGRKGTAGKVDMPPGMQAFVKRLPPDKQKDAWKKWQNASSEDRQKAIKKFMQRAQGAGGNQKPQRGGGGQRPQRKRR